MVRGDLLQEPADAIVNAANGHLAHGGGVAGIIRVPRGRPFKMNRTPSFESGPFPTGSAVATTAGKLPFRAVIHAVGPRQGEGDEEAKLVRALAAAFGLAKTRGWQTVSFPAAPISKVRLCLRDQPIIDAVLKELRK